MVLRDKQNFLGKVQNLLDNIEWVFPVGCNGNCRRNLRNFVNSLRRDLEEKLTVVYITDVGMNKGVWFTHGYSSIEELNMKIECSDIGSERYYIPYPGRSSITAASIYYMTESGKFERSTKALGLEPYDLFPEPCIMIRYEDKLEPCCTFGDNDINTYQFILNDIPAEFGLKGVNILGGADESYYMLKEHSIPEGVSLYILFSTTCIKNVYRGAASKKYIVGGYKVKKIYVQRVSRLLVQHLEKLKEQISSVLKEVIYQGVRDEGLRVLATEDIYTLLRVVPLLIERLEIVVPLGEPDTCFFGKYFANNPCYTRRKILEPYIQNKINEFKRKNGKYPSSMEYYRLLLKSFDCIPKYDRKENRKRMVQPNCSYAILVDGPDVRKKELEYSFGRKCLCEILKELEKD